MIARSIRSRMVVVAVLPVALVVICIAVAFWMGRARDLEDAHQQRVDLLVRQVSLFGGYGLFSGNSASLKNVVDGAQREPDVLLVSLFGEDGTLLASAGEPNAQTLQALRAPEYLAARRAQGVGVIVETISPAKLPLDDLFPDTPPAATPPILGYLVLEVSRSSIHARKMDALVTTAWIGLAAILMGALLAIQMGNSVVGPILRVSRMVGRIGRGDFSVEDDLSNADPFKVLQESLNQMAGRLAWGRDELEQRVEVVTQALRLEKEQAEDATQAKSRFLANASHDLRQPTHALGMFVARLGQMPMEPQMRQVVERLDMSVQSLQNLLDGLLDLSRLEAGDVHVRLRPVSVAEVFDSTLDTLMPVAQAKGLRLRVRPTAVWVQSDALHLQRMVMNLALNALRYTDQGTVLIACRPDHGGLGARIEVWDSGIGIAAVEQQNIFKEFYQVKAGNALRERVAGLGLGLNIVERTAALLGYHVSLRSSPGCGTRFSISMPQRVAPTAEPPRSIGRIRGGMELDGLEVLLIEDDVSARLAVRELLLSWNCSVVAVGSANDARALVWGARMPDVIVSDYQLGAGDNGLNAIASLRKILGHDVAACLMSGDADQALQDAAKEAGLTLLQKPVRPAKLRSLLRRLAGHRTLFTSPPKSP